LSTTPNFVVGTIAIAGVLSNDHAVSDSWVFGQKESLERMEMKQPGGGQK
jgi:hypothetical protein